jgi:hypothetical protein
VFRSLSSSGAESLSAELLLSGLVKVARLVKESYSEVVKGLDEFVDTRFYPPRSEEPEMVLRYFFFMVAIDHRTSKLGPFEGYVDGEFFHGADMLYRLGKLRYDQDPDFFSPERMSRITPEDVEEWLTAPSGMTIWDPSVRAELLRDAGRKLLRLFGGSVSKLLNASGGRIRGFTSAGLSNFFKVFKAYSDPVEKKLFLFIKFTTRRGLLEVVDEHNIETPVDNHLTRIALRLGIVRTKKELLQKILSKVEFTEQEDIEIRMAVRRAYKLVSHISGIRPDYLDDYLWSFGRKYCTREKPACESIGRCPLSEACTSFGKASSLTEHSFTNTFYY